MHIERQTIMEEALDSISDSVFTINMHGSIVYANRAFAALFGLSPDAIIGHTGDEFGLPLSTLMPMKSEPLASHTDKLIGIDLSTIQGRCYFEYSVDSIYDADGTVKAIVGVLRAEEPHREVARQYEKFLNLVSHELRTPLAAIKGNVQLARRQARRLMKLDVPEVIEFTNKIDGMLTRAERQIDIEARMVNDMLDVSRIQGKRIEIHLDAFDLVKLVAHVVESERIAEQTRVIHLALPLYRTLTVSADAERIEQVLISYLSNAFKYAPPQEPIDVVVESNGQQARVSVHDRGPGLTQEEQQLVWERFYQTPDRTVLNGQSTGLGLGLYISKVLIEHQHGHVGVESNKGHGATFWFSLPLAHDDEAHTQKQRLS